MKPSLQKPALNVVTVAALLLLAFLVGALLPLKADAQGDGNCPPGTIGNCTSLQIIGTRCSGVCTVYDIYFGETWISCKRTFYLCDAPRTARYTVGDCVYNCFQTE